MVMESGMEYIGPDDLRRGPKAAVLNSRQSKFPVGADPWVAATVRAVASLRERGWTLVASLGLHTWELALTVVSRLQQKTIVIVPGRIDDRMSAMEDIRRRFGLDPGATGFGFLHHRENNPPKRAWPARDAAVARLADRLLPVSVRPGGTMAALLDLHRHKVDPAFVTPYDKTPRPRPRYDAAALDADVDWNRWLIHFTRTCAGPWPDETDFDYYDAVIASTDEYCRSARKTLMHILETGVIRASADNIRGRFPVVPFAGVDPDTAPGLFRYRPRLVNPGLEPYGIAVRKDAALALGLRPVTYGLPEQYDRLAPMDKPYFQHRGRFASQWMIEHEWRRIGDFPLDAVRPEHRRIIVPDASVTLPPKPAAAEPVIGLFRRKSATNVDG